MRLWFAAALLLAWHGAAVAADAAAAANEFKESYVEPKIVTVLGGWAGSDSAVTAKDLDRIMDQAAWVALWHRHAPSRTPPAVDFAKTMVVAIFTGAVSSSVGGLHLESVVGQGADIQVMADLYVSDVIDDKTHNLYLFVVVPPSTGTITVCLHRSGIMMAPKNIFATFGEIDTWP